MSLFSRFRNAPAQPPTPPPDGLAQDAPPVSPQDEDVLQAAIAAKDSDAIHNLVIHGASTKIRQLAAEAIDDPEHIRQLLRKVRGGNDKSVYKILARKRDALLAVEREVQQVQAEVTATAAAIERHSHRPFDPLFTPTLEQLEERWNAVAVHAAPEISHATQDAIDRARDVIAQHLREVAAKAARQLAAANEAAAAEKRREQQQQAAAERAKALEDQRKAEVEKRAREEQSLKQIAGLLRKAQGALSAGSSKAAAGLRRAIEEKLATAPSLPPALAKQLQHLDTKLAELKDWKSFSVAPKRIELIERMESLIGATMHPTALAGHIKDLQEQWRTLSKGAGENTESEWQRFHDAAQKAFQPCRDYFAEQDRIKQQNLEQRGLLYERLHAFEQKQNWEEPDWRTAITAVREAKQLWREHAPVDAAACEELQRKFNELTATLQARIDAEYARNVKQKKSIIERARVLSTSADGRAATDEVKRLQEKWKSVGPVPRHEDHALWEEFRKQCDAVFQKRQDERASHNAQLEAHRSQAAALCEQLESIAILKERELLESAKKLPELRLAFDAIDDLPKNNARQLRDRFDRAFSRCRKAVAIQQAQDAERGWTDLLDAANDVRAYRLALVRGAEPTEIDALKNKAEDHLAKITHSPKRGVEALRSTLAQAPNSDLSANELALRTLCIRAEILTESPTPDIDQPLRREYQVKRLMQSMGQGVKPQEGELDALTMEWLGAGPVEEATYLQLAERFKECRSKAVRRE